MTNLDPGWLKRQVNASERDIVALGGSLDFADIIAHAKKQQERIEALEAELRKYQWRPIAEAKPGEIMLLLSRHRQVAIGSVYQPKTPPLRKSANDPLPPESEWIVNAEGAGWGVTGNMGYPTQFTDYMPLPQPPTTKEKPHA